MHSIRAFLAVELSSEVRSRAAQLIARLRDTTARVKWVEPRHMHLTLKFLGDVDLKQIPELSQRVSAAVAELPPFDVRAVGAGAFPNRDHARTVWIGIREGAEDLVTLHDYLDQQLAPLGFRSEQRRFKPHLTLGRVRGEEGADDLAERLRQYEDYVAGASDVAEVVLFSSELSREGPEYEPISYAPLVGA